MNGTTKRTRPQPRPLIGEEGAKRSAALILEVLAGLRTPSEASTALGVTAMRYYVLERRALEGMVQALAPRPKGKRRRPEDALQEAGREKVRLEREMGRLQALVRAGGGGDHDREGEGPGGPHRGAGGGPAGGPGAHGAGPGDAGAVPWPR